MILLYFGQVIVDFSRSKNPAKQRRKRHYDVKGQFLQENE